MNEYCRLAYVALFLATIASPAAACTQTESEDKVMEVIYALSDMLRRNPDKAGTMAKKFEQVLGDAKQPAPDARATQAAIDKLCKDVDEILTELRR
jgi:hypothetical protein